MQQVVVEAIIEDLVRWIRHEVAPVLASDANCKLIANISTDGDVQTTVEQHRRRRVKTTTG